MNKKVIIRNPLSAALANVVNILVNFLAQKLFLGILNVEYLGINGLFSNIISMLSIFELGIGTAITFSLYSPLAKKDSLTVKALMIFYKKAYRIIAAIVGIIGLCVMPFLPNLIKEIPVDINIYIIYALFLADAVSSYFMTYRRSILYADQKNYIINYIHIISIIIMNTIQIGILAITRNY